MYTIINSTGAHEFNSTQQDYALKFMEMLRLYEESYTVIIDTDGIKKISYYRPQVFKNSPDKLLK